MTYKRAIRLYPDDEIQEGKSPKFISVTYTLWYDKNGALCDIRNEYHCSVDKNSEVWEFYNK